MQLTVIRHGETIENQNYIVQGQMPGHLSDVGIKQSKQLTRKLAQEKFDTIYCSDLQRCRDTAKFIIEEHLDTPIEYVPDIREFNFGIFQGKHTKSVDWNSVKSGALDTKIEEGESWLDVTSRVLGFLNKIYKENSKQHVLLITHKGPIRIMLACFKNQPLEYMLTEPVPNDGILHFEMAEPINMERFKDLKGVNPS